tara:strand:+ start:2807 stop:3355 length:549 start_codon:yes stop_codon:yes gene_type:complete
MDDNQPEMIPMPGPVEQDPRGAPPASFTKEVTPQEEANLLMGLMGSTYGELKKLDGSLIGGSSNQFRSEQMKQTITNNLNQIQQRTAPTPPPNIPVDNTSVQPQPPQPPTPPPPPTEPVVQPIQDDSQLTFNFDVTEKDILFDKIEKLTAKVNSLGHRLDQIFEIVNKPKTPKKKSVKKEEV